MRETTAAVRGATWNRIRWLRTQLHLWTLQNLCFLKVTPSSQWLRMRVWRRMSASLLLVRALLLPCLTSSLVRGGIDEICFSAHRLHLL